MTWDASPSITAETPRPPKDSLYSLQPMRPSSVLIFKKSKLRWPASACRCSIFVTFMAESPGSAGTAPGSGGELRQQLHRLGLLGDERQPGDATVGPGAVVLADPPDRAHQRHLVAELVGDGGDGFVLALGQVQLLDALRGVAEAAADHHLLVEVLVAVAHAADVERHAGLHAGERAAHVVGHRHLGARLDLEVGEALAGACAPKAFLEPRPEHRHQPRHEAERKPAVGDLGCQLDVRLGAGPEPDWEPRVHVENRDQRLADSERTRP